MTLCLERQNSYSQPDHSLSLADISLASDGVICAHADATNRRKAPAAIETANLFIFFITTCAQVSDHL